MQHYGVPLVLEEGQHHRDVHPHRPDIRHQDFMEILHLNSKIAELREVAGGQDIFLEAIYNWVHERRLSYETDIIYRRMNFEVRFYLYDNSPI